MFTQTYSEKYIQKKDISSFISVCYISKQTWQSLSYLKNNHIDSVIEMQINPCN